MLILTTLALLLLTALVLALLRWLRPELRYLWLIAAGGTLLAWLSVWLWQIGMPQTLALPGWRPVELFPEAFTLITGQLLWPYALGLVSLTTAVLLTAPARSSVPSAGTWAAMLSLTALGLLAVLADNALTMLLVWAAIDLAELLVQLQIAERPALSEGAVASFAARTLGTGLLIWVTVTRAPLSFEAVPVAAGPALVIAAGLRLGVLPLHLPLRAESTLRRDFGSVLRLMAAASSLVLLARIPAEGAGPTLTPWLLGLSGLAGVYAGWNWLRARDELAGRPFWILGMASLSIGAALRGNPQASVAWGAALLLAGGALFLSSLQQTWLKRALLLGAFGLSALPFSLTAIGWSGSNGGWTPLLLFVPAQALLLAGYIRHALRPAKESYENQARWAQAVYPPGLGILLVTLLVSGLWGWPGAASIGAWGAGLAAVAIAALLTWLTPRLRILQSPAHWVGQESPAWQRGVTEGFWTIYRWLGRQAGAVLNLLEGDGGVLWALLVIALFIAYFASGAR